jgi:hypothetical protein
MALPFINRINTDSPLTDIRPLGSSMRQATSLHSLIIDPIPSNSSQVEPSIISSTSANISKVGETPSSLITINQTDITTNVIESSKQEDNIEFELLIKSKQPSPVLSKSLSSTDPSLVRSMIKINKANVKRTLSTANTINMQRRKRIGLTPIIIDNRRYIHHHGNTSSFPETNKNKDKTFATKTILNIEKIDKQQSNEIPTRNAHSPSLFSFN